MTWCALDTPEFICLVLSGGKPGSTICLLENRNEHAINCSRYCMHASRFEVDFISVSSFVFFFFCEGVSSFVHTAVLKLNVFRLLGCTYVSVDDCMASTRNSIHFHFPEKENRIFIFTSAWFREEGLKWLNRFHFTEKEKR